MSFQFINKIDKYSTLFIETNKNINTPEFNSLTNDYFNTDIDITLENLSIDQTFSIVNELSNNFDKQIAVEGFFQNLWEGIKQFFAKLIGWIKNFFSMIVGWLKKIFKYIYYFLTGKLEKLNLQDEATQKRLEEAAKNINEKINNIKKPYITLEEQDGIIDFVVNAYNGISQLFADLKTKRGFTFSKGTMVKQLIEEGSLDTSSLPQWLEAGLINDNFKLDPPEHSIKEMCEDIRLPKITKDTVIDSYKKYGKVLKNQLDHYDRLSQNLCNKLFNIEVRAKEKLGDYLIDKINASGIQKDAILNNLKIFTQNFSNLIVKSSTNQLHAFNEIFRIFESELKDLLKAEQIRLEQDRDLDDDNILEVLDTATPVTTFEGYKVYKYMDIWKLHDKDINEAKASDSEINASAARAKYTLKPLITITSAMLKFANSDELKVVLAHEYGHIAQHHSIIDWSKKAYKTSTLNKQYLIFTDRMPDYRPLRHEIEADAYSVKFCGFDTTMNFLNKLNEVTNGIKYMIPNKDKTGKTRRMKLGVENNGKFRYGYKDEIVDRLTFFEKMADMNKDNWPDWFKKILN